MKRVIIFLLVFVLFSGVSIAYIGIAGVDFVPNQLIVKFKPSANIQNSQQAKNFLQSQSSETISKSERAFPVIKKINTIGLDRIYVIDYNPHVDIEKIMNIYKNNPNIEYAHPNFYGYEQTIPNDPNYPNILSANQSGLRSLTPEKAWDYTTGSSNIIIAEPDTGVNISHPDLNGKIYININDPINGIDDDLNGCIDDYYGCDITTYNGNNILDLNTLGHGTRIAGVIGASTNNTIGIAGTCWNCKIMVVRIINTTLSNPTTLTVNRGVIFSVDNNANIISMSTAFAFNNSLLSDSAIYADQNNVLYLAAAGNQNNNPLNAAIYPGLYTTVLGVAGLFDNGTKWITTSTFGSNYGTWVDISAPAYKVISTLKNGSIGTTGGGHSGTSFAAPFVAAQAGLILSMWPGLNKAQVEHIIKNTTDNIDALNPGFEGQLGTGRINLTRSLEFGCSDGTRLRTCNGPYYCDFIRAGTTTALNVNITMCGSCTDSDGGINENLTGEIYYFDDTGTQVTHMDTCQNKNTLTEYHCVSNQGQSIQINCGTGRECTAGACTQAQPKAPGGSPIYKKRTPTQIQESPGQEILGFLIPISRFLRFIIPVF